VTWQSPLWQPTLPQPVNSSQPDTPPGYPTYLQNVGKNFPTVFFTKPAILNNLYWNECEDIFIAVIETNPHFIGKFTPPLRFPTPAILNNLYWNECEDFTTATDFMGGISPIFVLQPPGFPPF
jgi:hypothetical protein